MATIHDTTMNPGKLALLRAWLPAQPWYSSSGRGPELTKAGGFRLDDPAGEVGIEFMVVTGAVRCAARDRYGPWRRGRTSARARGHAGRAALAAAFCSRRAAGSTASIKVPVRANAAG